MKLKVALVAAFLFLAAISSFAAPTVLNVQLSWTQSSSPNITGNCIYRATVSGGPYGTALTCSSTPIVAYTDSTVSGGTTYYYVVTAYTGIIGQANYVESAYSNQTTAVVPVVPLPPTGLSNVVP